MKSFEVPTDVTIRMRQKAKDPGCNMAAEVAQAAQAILPGYSGLHRTAAEAVPKGAGTCYANSEVVAKIARTVPGMSSFVVLLYKPTVRSMHGENLVIDSRGTATVINNAGSSPLMTAPNPDTPEELVADRLRAGDGQTMAYGAVDYRFNWRTRALENITDSVPEDCDFDPTRRVLVMPSDVGLRVMETVALARAVYRGGNQAAYQALLTDNAAFMPSFDITPVVESMASQSV